MEPRAIYGLLRMCSLFTIVNKVYPGHEYFLSDRLVIGFSARIDPGMVSTNIPDEQVLKKHLMLQRIKDWCADRKLPVEIQDQEKSLVMFKIVIIKK